VLVLVIRVCACELRGAPAPFCCAILGSGFSSPVSALLVLIPCSPCGRRDPGQRGSEQGAMHRDHKSFRSCATPHALVLSRPRRQRAADCRARTPATGTGRSSGMLREGDIIKRVDSQNTAGMRSDEVHQLLQGPAGSTVMVRYVRPPSQFEMRCE